MIGFFLLKVGKCISYKEYTISQVNSRTILTPVESWLH
jgi:hypothetical protein